MLTDNNERYNDFLNTYHNVISEHYSEIERERHRFLLIGILSIIVFVLILFGLYKFFDDTYSWTWALFFFVFISVLIIIPLIVILLYLNSNYRKYLKDKILSKVLKECCNIEPILETPNLQGLLLSGESLSKIDDCFKMTYKNMTCKIFEMEIDRTGKRGDVVNSAVIQLPNNKNLQGKVILNSKTSPIVAVLASLLIIIYVVAVALAIAFKFIPIMEGLMYNFALLVVLDCIYIEYKKHRKMKKNLGSKDFMSKFEVLADYPDEAKTEITSKLIYRMYSFQKRFKGKAIRCVFYEDKVYLVIFVGLKNLFEIGNLFVPINKSTAIYKFYSDINMLYKTMDYFFQ